MAAPIGLGFIFVVTGVIFGVLGLFMLMRGHWPKRAGVTPHCRHCDYILSGLEADRCPECGSVVQPGGVIYGERHRRAGLAFLGGTFALIGLGCIALFLSGALSTIDWNRYKPLSWLLKEIDSPNMTDANVAWTEVQRRMTAGTLSEREQNLLVEKAMQAQQSARSHNYDQQLFQLLTNRFVSHQLSSAQEEKFFAVALKVVLEVRPIVGSEDTVPYWIWSRGRGPDGWWVVTQLSDWQIDGSNVDLNQGVRGGSTGFHGGGTGRALAPQKPGKHHLHVKAQLSVNAPGRPHNDQGPFDKIVTRILDADFESINGHSPIITFTTPAASVLQPVFKADLSFENNYLNLTINANAPPVDLALDCFILSGGKEYPIGSVNFQKSSGGGFGTATNQYPVPMPAKVDVILRSSEAAARGTTTLTQIWKGEIALKDVPVNIPTTMLSPVTPLSK